MHVDDVAAAVRFFTDVLGFQACIHVHDYAYVQREVVGIRITNASQSEGERVPPGNRRFMYYIDVEDVDGLYAELKPKLDMLPRAPRSWPGRPTLRPARTDDPRTRWQPGRLRSVHLRDANLIRSFTSGTSLCVERLSDNQMIFLNQSKVAVSVESAVPFICHSQRESAFVFLHTNSKSF